VLIGIVLLGKAHEAIAESVSRSRRTNQRAASDFVKQPITSLMMMSKDDLDLSATAAAAAAAAAAGGTAAVDATSLRRTQSLTQFDVLRQTQQHTAMTVLASSL